MNREDAKNKLEIFAAFANGEQIQWHDGDEWNDISALNDFFADPIGMYRIKPEPEVIYVNKTTSGYDFVHDNEEAAVDCANNSITTKYTHVAKKFIACE